MVDPVERVEGREGVLEDRLDLAPFTLVVHDYGGPVALPVCFSRPEPMSSRSAVADLELYVLRTDALLELYRGTASVIANIRTLTREERDQLVLTCGRSTLGAPATAPLESASPPRLTAATMTSSKLS